MDLYEPRLQGKQTTPSSNPSNLTFQIDYTLAMTYSLPTDHASLADDPPVAATQSGGPKESPGLLVKPKKFQYDVSIKRPAWKVAEVQVVQGFFMQNGPKPKAHDFEHMVSTIATYLIPPAVDPMRHRADQKLRRSFGMVDQSSDRWANLKRDVAKLQDEATAGVQYKVFFLGESIACPRYWLTRQPVTDRALIIMLSCKSVSR